MATEMEMIENRKEALAVEASGTSVVVNLTDDQLNAISMFNPRRKTAQEIADGGVNGAIKALVYAARESARKSKDVAFRAGNKRMVEVFEENFQIANQLYTRL